MDYKKTLLKRWFESEEIKNKTKKTKKKFKIVKKIEEVEETSIEKVFCNSDIRNIIMKEKQKLLDAEFEKFKDIGWKEIMTIDQFRDIIIEYFRDTGYMDKKTRLNLKLDWHGLCEFINETSSSFWDYFMYDMDYYYEREAFKRKLNGEPLIDTTYERQYPPKQKQKKNTMDEDTKLVCKLLRKTYKNKKQWANKLTQIGREKGFLTQRQCWKKINTLEYAIASYMHHLEEDKKLSEYLLCVKQLIDDHDDIEMGDWDLYY